MNEKTEFVKTTTHDYIDEETWDYVKSKATEDGRYRFYIRIVKTHFVPCLECQQKLHDILTKSDYLVLGNKDYEPAIELNRYYEIDDKSWVELERHKATEKDFIKVYGFDKGPKYWADHQKAMTEN